MNFNTGLTKMKAKSSTVRIFLSVLIGIILGLGIFVFLIGRPKVAVINIVNGEINSETTPQLMEVLRYVREDRNIKAVVIKLSSPGGGTADSSQLFMNMIKLREKKPVVVAVTDMAASGGYHLLLGANYVYTNPEAFVGNVGVILWLPPQGNPSENIVTSGPFKRTGGSERMYLSVLEMLKDAFILTVVSQRGDRLKMSVQELAEGRIYLGFEAARLGMVDELGSEDDAINKAASLAHIRNYQVLDVNKEFEKQGVKLTFAGKGNYSLASFTPEFPYLYYRFVEPR